MKNSEFITLLLCAFGYTKDIDISIVNKGHYGVLYEVSATHWKTGHQVSFLEEDFYMMIYAILDELKNSPLDDTLLGTCQKFILNKVTRDKLIDDNIKNKKEILSYIKDISPLTKFLNTYHICKSCKLTSHTYPDSMHYFCEDHHTMRCPHLKKFLQLQADLYQAKDDAQKRKEIEQEIIQLYQYTSNENR